MFEAELQSNFCLFIVSLSSSMQVFWNGTNHLTIQQANPLDQQERSHVFPTYAIAKCKLSRV